MFFFHIASLAEDHPVEGAVELHVHPDTRLLALHLQPQTSIFRTFYEIFKKIQENTMKLLRKFNEIFINI